MKTVTTILILAYLTISDAALASAYCSEPSAPSCATIYGAFDDASDFDECQRKMRSYKGDVESFTSCQRDAAEEAIRESDQAVSQFNDAVRSFNRRANGG